MAVAVLLIKENTLGLFGDSNIFNCSSALLPKYIYLETSSLTGLNSFCIILLSCPITKSISIAKLVLARGNLSISRCSIGLNKDCI